MIHSVLIFILVFGLRFGGGEQGADCGACSHIRILFQIFILFFFSSGFGQGADCRA